MDSAARDRLRARSNGTAWTKEQLLFHMVFGFLVVRSLLPLVRLFSSLPPWMGRAFARLLQAEPAEGLQRGMPFPPAGPLASRRTEPGGGEGIPGAALQTPSSP